MFGVADTRDNLSIRQMLQYIQFPLLRLRHAQADCQPGVRGGKAMLHHQSYLSSCVGCKRNHLLPLSSQKQLHQIFVEEFQQVMADPTHNLEY